MAIEHVVVLMMENHSFDRALGNLFPNQADRGGIGDALPPQNPQSNTDTTVQPGVSYQQQATSDREVDPDPGHDLDNVLRQLDLARSSGTPCAGFVTDYATMYPNSTAAQRQEVMGYYPPGGLPVLHALAENFAICDRWFSSLPGPTWPNRFFVHSGTSLGHVDMPEGVFQWNLHVYDQDTLYDRLEQRGISWKIYFGDIPQSLVMIHQEQYLDHYCEMSDFCTDAAGSEQSFPRYCFIEPNYFSAPNDQHPPHDVFRGEALIAQVYNAIRKNEALWQKTLLVVLYDEHGGFYDHVDPPNNVAAPDTNTKQFSFTRLGARVPAILISPWIKKQVISDTFDHTSLLRFLTDKWGLGALGLRTASAASFGNYVAATAQATGAALPAITVPSFNAPQRQTDLSRNQSALLAFSESLASRIQDPIIKQQLLMRAVEVQGGPAQAAQLAVDRLRLFIADRKAAPQPPDVAQTLFKPASLASLPTAAAVPQGAKGKWTRDTVIAFWFFVAMIVLINLGSALNGSVGWRADSWVATLGLMACIFAALGKAITGRSTGMFIDDRNTMSLSRFQLVAWTSVIVSALITVAIWNVFGPRGSSAGLEITITQDLLALIGLSGFTSVAAPAILDQKTTKAANASELAGTIADLTAQGHRMGAIQNDGQVITKQEVSDATWMDLFRGDEVGNGSHVDLSKVQKFFFTIVMAMGYCAALWVLLRDPAQDGPIKALPDISPTFVGLLGVSHATYLAYKAVPHSRDPRS